MGNDKEFIFSNSLPVYLKRHKKQIMLYEGLISSYPMMGAIKVYLSQLHASNYNAYPNKTTISKEFRNTFEIRVDLANNSNKETDAQNIFSIFNKCSDLSGWLPSTVSHDAQLSPYTMENLTFFINEFNRIQFSVEAKFDIEINKEILPKYLYHVTKISNVKRILKQGLVPRSNGKLSTHPDRVYFALTLKIAEEFKNIIEPMVGDEPLNTILKINTKWFPPYVRLFQDPNWLNKAIYTMNNIPIVAISTDLTEDNNETT